MDADFCGQCCAPISGLATVDPLRQVHSIGWMYRRAISGRPSRVIFLGMWLILGPGVVICVLGLLAHFIDFAALGPIPAPEQATAHFSEDTRYPAETSDGSPIVDRIQEVIGLILGSGIALLEVGILWRFTSRYFAPRDETDGEPIAEDDPDQGSGPD